jgi:hypothetical protein
MSINSLNGSYNSASSSATNNKMSGFEQSDSMNSTKAGDIATATANKDVVINISDSAKVALAQANAEPSFKDVGIVARAKLDALKQQAADKTGTTASSVNVQLPGVIDYSSFSDQEVAAMNLNSSGNFSKDEQIQAGGILGERMRVSLETYRGATDLGDRRGQAMTIDLLYKQMTPEVRSALNWTPAMMAANDQMLAGDESKFGKLEISGILANLRTTKAHGGLMFNG